MTRAVHAIAFIDLFMYTVYPPNSYPAPLMTAVTLDVAVVVVVVVVAVVVVASAAVAAVSAGPLLPPALS